MPQQNITQEVKQQDIPEPKSEIETRNKQNNNPENIVANNKERRQEENVQSQVPLSQEQQILPIIESETEGQSATIDQTQSISESRQETPLINQNPDPVKPKVNNENLVNFDDIPIVSKTQTFEELLQKEIAKGDEPDDPPEDSRTSIVHQRQQEVQKLKRKMKSQKDANDPEPLKNPLSKSKSYEEESSTTDNKEGKKHSFLKRNTGRVTNPMKKTSKAKKYSYYRDNFESKTPQTSRQQKPEKVTERPAKKERDVTPKLPARKFLVKGGGRGGGKGNTSALETG